MPDLSAAAAHLRQEARKHEAIVRYGDPETFDLEWHQRLGATNHAVAGLLEAIAEWREHGYQGYATENELADAAGAVAAVVVPEETK